MRKNYKLRHLNRNITFWGKAIPSGYFEYSFYMKDGTVRRFYIDADNMREADDIARRAYIANQEQSLWEVR